jgi:hypothetical protein
MDSGLGSGRKLRISGLRVSPSTKPEREMAAGLQAQEEIERQADPANQGDMHEEPVATGGEIISEINPIIRGWVNYFRMGHSSRTFAYVRLWVEKRVRNHMMRARQCSGFGWMPQFPCFRYIIIEVLSVKRKISMCLIGT